MTQRRRDGAHRVVVRRSAAAHCAPLIRREIARWRFVDDRRASSPPSRARSARAPPRRRRAHPAGRPASRAVRRWRRPGRAGSSRCRTAAAPGRARRAPCAALRGGRSAAGRTTGRKAEAGLRVGHAMDAVDQTDRDRLVGPGPAEVGQRHARAGMVAQRLEEARPAEAPGAAVDEDAAVKSSGSSSSDASANTGWTASSYGYQLARHHLDTGQAMVDRAAQVVDRPGAIGLTTAKPISRSALAMHQPREMRVRRAQRGRVVERIAVRQEGREQHADVDARVVEGAQHVVRRSRPVRQRRCASMIIRLRRAHPGRDLRQVAAVGVGGGHDALGECVVQQVVDLVGGAVPRLRRDGRRHVAAAPQAGRATRPAPPRRRARSRPHRRRRAPRGRYSMHHVLDAGAHHRPAAGHVLERSGRADEAGRFVERERHQAQVPAGQQIGQHLVALHAQPVQVGRCGRQAGSIFTTGPAITTCHCGWASATAATSAGSSRSSITPK